MDFQIDCSHEEYIKITVTGVIDKSGLIAAISQLMNHPQYLDKHSLWDFTGAAMGLTISDLKEIAGVLKLYKPQKKDFSDRSALLVAGRFTSAMADMFVSMSKRLPFKYRVFTSNSEAVAYLCS